MRLLAGTATETAAPPPAGVSDNEDTDTSKAITLSAGASPKRTCVDVVPAGVGVGLALLATAPPPPPQPTASAISATSMKVKVNLATWLKEFLEIWVFICISPGGDQAAWGSFSVHRLKSFFEFFGSGHRTVAVTLAEQLSLATLPGQTLAAQWQSIEKTSLRGFKLLRLNEWKLGGTRAPGVRLRCISAYQYSGGKPAKKYTAAPVKG